MPATHTKLPANDLPLIRDPELARAVESELEPYSGKRLDAAQAAIRRIHASGIEGQFSVILGAYRSAITDAVGKARAD